MMADDWRCAAGVVVQSGSRPGDRPPAQPSVVAVVAVRVRPPPRHQPATATSGTAEHRQSQAVPGSHTRLQTFITRTAGRVKLYLFGTNNCDVTIFVTEVELSQ